MKIIYHLFGRLFFFAIFAVSILNKYIMKITQADLLAMTTEELTTLNKMIVATFKAKRTLDGATIASDLKLKQEIKVNAPNHKNDIFIIEKINKTTASCTIKGTNKSYKVPFNMIITKW